MAEDMKAREPKAPAATGRQYRVMVRHSPFRLKKLDVEARSEDEAKQKFLVEAKKVHDAKADAALVQKGVDPQARADAAQAIRDAFDRGVANARDLEWLIRPVEEAIREREELMNARERMWGRQPELVGAGK